MSVPNNDNPDNNDEQNEAPAGTEDENPTEEVEDSQDESVEGEDEDGEDNAPGSDLSLEQALDALKQTRTEAKNYRLRLRDAEARLAEARTPEQIQALVDEMRSERENAERALMVENVALKFNLPEALASRLQGSTREEMEADAKALAALIPVEQDDADNYDGGLTPGRRDDLPDDPAALARRVNRGRKSVKR